jgi:hypothetical protein
MPLHSNRRNRPLRIYDMSATHPTAFNAGINPIRGDDLASQQSRTVPTPEAIGDDTESSRDLKDEKASTSRFRLKKRTSSRLFQKLFRRHADSKPPIAAANPTPEIQSSTDILNVAEDNPRNLEAKRKIYNGRSWQGKVIIYPGQKILKLFCKFTWTYLTEVQRGKLSKTASVPRQFEDFQCYTSLFDLGNRFCHENETISDILLLQENEKLYLAAPTNALSTLLEFRPPFITITIIRLGEGISETPKKLNCKFHNVGELSFRHPKTC